jgi:hypothetical protein
MDADGSVTLTWREAGSTSWETATVDRADGCYTATLPLIQPTAYELRAALADPDGVQLGSEITHTVVLTATLEPQRVFLPLVLRQ